MRRVIPALCITIALVLLCACAPNSSLSETGTWSLEYVSDKSGNIIAYGPGFEGETLDLTCILSGTHFEMQNSGQLLAGGSYSKKNGSDTLTLTLEYDNGVKATAVCGEKPDSGAYLTLETEENIFSFIRAE